MNKLHAALVVLVLIISTKSFALNLEYLPGPSGETLFSRPVFKNSDTEIVYKQRYTVTRDDLSFRAFPISIMVRTPQYRTTLCSSYYDCPIPELAPFNFNLKFKLGSKPEKNEAVTINVTTLHQPNSEMPYVDVSAVSSNDARKYKVELKTKSTYEWQGLYLVVGPLKNYFLVSRLK
ncbi:MAG: hypothetical protein HYV97_08015 [Bdellovibrio sp.]|nr:hypothetical protein [Bdellovibrio sp.]